MSLNLHHLQDGFHALKILKLENHSAFRKVQTQGCKWTSGVVKMLFVSHYRQRDKGQGVWGDDADWLWGHGHQDPSHQVLQYPTNPAGQWNWCWLILPLCHYHQSCFSLCWSPHGLCLTPDVKRYQKSVFFLLSLFVGHILSLSEIGVEFLKTSLIEKQVRMQYRWCSSGFITCIESWGTPHTHASLAP